jgi:AcrR family transcriptional regulator
MDRSIATQVREQVAQLLAAGRFTVAEIAKKCQVSERTVYNWQKDGRFAARVKQIVDAYAESALKIGLAVKANRILELQKHYNRLDEMVENRRTRTEFSFVPDYDSGFIVVTEMARVRAGRGASTNRNAETQNPAVDPEQSQANLAWPANLGSDLYRVKCQTDHATISAMTSILDQIASEVGHKVSKAEVSMPRRIEELTNEELLAFARRLGISAKSFDGATESTPEGT